MSKKSIIVLTLWIVYIIVLEKTAKEMKCNHSSQCEVDLSTPVPGQKVLKSFSGGVFGSNKPQEEDALITPNFSDDFALEVALGCLVICENHGTPPRYGYPYEIGWCTCLATKETNSSSEFGEQYQNGDWTDTYEETALMTIPQTHSLYCRPIVDHICLIFQDVIFILLCTTCSVTLYMSGLIISEISQNPPLQHAIMTSIMTIGLPEYRRKRQKRRAKDVKFIRL